MYILEVSCNDSALGPILSIAKNLLSVIQIVVPILLLLMVSIQLFKLVTNPEEKNGLKKILNMSIAAVVVFLIPMLINMTMGILGENSKFSNCWNNTSSIGLGNSTYINPYKDKKKTKVITDQKYEKGSSQGACLSKGSNTKVLFVGNSKTYVSNIPAKFKGIANNNGYNVTVKTATRGGATLNELASEYASSIGGEAFDCVILQEQTDTYGGNYDGYSNGATKIVNIVRSKNNNVKTYIRALWITSGSSSSARERSYSWTEKIAKNTNSTVIYDGKNFDKSRSSNSINLFGDSIHQNNNGAYLSALTIYQVLSGDKNVSTTYYGAVGESTAKQLISVVNG